MKRIICVIALLSLLFTSCHPLFCVWNLGYEPIKKSNNQPLVNGLYVLDKHSIDQMKYEGYYTITHHSLELLSDGTYKFVNLPDWFFNPFGQSLKNVIDKEGHWNVQYNDGEGYRIDFDGFNNPSYGVLSRKNNKQAILINIGDPDSCIGLVYVKVK